MGRAQSTGGVSPAGDRITITLHWRGKRIRPTISLKPTEANLKAARRMRAEMVKEIRIGTFDLAKAFPDYRFLPPESKEVGPTFGRAVELWWKLLDKEHSTKVGYRKTMNYYWKPLYERPVVDITLEELVDLLTSYDISRKTRNNILIPLRGAFRTALAQKWITTDPTTLIENSRLQRQPPDPFSQQEAEAILTALRERDPAIADYFEFAFYAGLRTSEQIALLWADVDLKAMTVHVHHARAERQDKATTKTHKARTVELNDRAAQVIQRQRARTFLVGKHVFHDPATGTGWHDNQGPWKPWSAVVRKLGIRYRPPKECRDTSVTIALQAGADPAYVAAQHGHSVAVMERDYAKWLKDGDGGRNRKRVNEALAPEDKESKSG